MADQPAQPSLPPPLLMMQLFVRQAAHLCVVRRGSARDRRSHERRALGVEDIAAKVGAHAPSLYRVMRMLASFGVSREPAAPFALTPVGDCSRPTRPARSATWR